MEGLDSLFDLLLPLMWQFTCVVQGRRLPELIYCATGRGVHHVPLPSRADSSASFLFFSSSVRIKPSIPLRAISSEKLVL